MKRSLLMLFLMATAAIASVAQQKSADEPFLIAVEDVFAVNGRGTVITGKVERGIIRTGEPVEIVTAAGPLATIAVEVTMYPKVLPEARGGDNVSILLKAVDKAAVARGDVAAKPGTISVYSKFTARVDLKATPDGGRARPVTAGFRTLVDIRTASRAGMVSLAEGKPEAAPGETGVIFTVEMTRPAPLEIGQSVTFREYGKVVATGTVTAVIPSK